MCTTFDDIIRLLNESIDEMREIEADEYHLYKDIEKHDARVSREAYEDILKSIMGNTIQIDAEEDVLDRLYAEYDDFIADIKFGDTENAINKAREITYKADILYLIEASALLQSMISPKITLEYLYQSWSDWSGESLKDCVYEAITATEGG